MKVSCSGMGATVDAWTRRRFGAAGFAALFAFGDRAGGAVGKDGRKQREKANRNLCRRDGRKCHKKGKTCQAEFCLQSPFTITAAWSVEGFHDTYLFLPPFNDATGPAPHIDWECSADKYFCDIAYPSACIEDAGESGEEVTTIHKLYPGRYEYWLQITRMTDAGEVVVTVRNRKGRIVRSWLNPLNAANRTVSWHVFDIDGTTGTIASVDHAFDFLLPGGAYPQSTYVCPM